MELHRFDSFGEFESAVVDVDLSVRLLGPRDGRWRLGHADVDGLTVQRGVESVPNLCEASGWPSHLMFLLSRGQPSPTWLNGVRFTGRNLGVLAPGRGFVFRAAGPNHWTSIALPLGAGLLRGDDVIGDVLRLWSRSTRMVETTPRVLQTLQDAALIGADPRTPPAEGRMLIENAIVNLVHSGSQRSTAIGRPAASNHELCDATLDFFSEVDSTGLVAAPLDGLPVGARSLRNFFHDCFGRGPMQYLNLRRLHAIHHALLDARRDSTSISETFEQNGYAYSSYALARYRALFGVAPSTTRDGVTRRAR
ncbi:MAG TPA: hypothetical protein DCR74_14070 [Achromobacter sp.]|uniref:AraC family transcriptional regulator n=1 Tax=Achromobacter animicus TaxID=1389935 RepID=UPI000EC71DCE|nr:hypothetical protein [Achromobacter sp.]